MALELKLKYVINPEATELKIVDESGIYSSPLNEGGWGAPNISRNSVALVAYLRYQPYSGAQQKSFLIDFNGSYPNSQVSEFIFDYTKDGWYKAALIAVPLSVGSPSENSIRFNTATTNLEIYKSALWVELEDEDDFDYLLDNTNPVVDTQEIIMAKLIQQRNCMLEEYIKCLDCTSCKCEVKKEELTKLNLLIQATDYRFYSQKEFEAQKMVERLTKQFKCCK